MIFAMINSKAWELEMLELGVSQTEIDDIMAVATQVGREGFQPQDVVIMAVNEYTLQRAKLGLPAGPTMNESADPGLFTLDCWAAEVVSELYAGIDQSDTVSVACREADRRRYVDAWIAVANSRRARERRLQELDAKRSRVSYDTRSGWSL